MPKDTKTRNAMHILRLVVMPFVENAHLNRRLSGQFSILKHQDHNVYSIAKLRNFIGMKNSLQVLNGEDQSSSGGGVASERAAKGANWAARVSSDIAGREELGRGSRMMSE